ncbi:hypothetical protein TQ38_027630 (plasmid) [Novosphingobium sp. P6W]|nr:hypothetical protein TQ38_027630 [Novosphingobium sp. P6W]
MSRLYPLAGVTLLAGAVLLQACAPTVHLNAPQILLPTGFDASKGAPLAAGRQESINRWWDQFHDTQLEQLIDLALVRSTDARTAYFRVMEARAARDQSVSQRLPSGNFTSSAKVQGGQQFEGQDLFGSTAPARTFSGGFAPSWELDVFGRLAAIGRSAQANYAAAAYDSRHPAGSRRRCGQRAVRSAWAISSAP